MRSLGETLTSPKAFAVLAVFFSSVSQYKYKPLMEQPDAGIISMSLLRARVVSLRTYLPHASERHLQVSLRTSASPICRRRTRSPMTPMRLGTVPALPWLLEVFMSNKTQTQCFLLRCTPTTPPPPTPVTPAHFLLHSKWPQLFLQSCTTVNTATVISLCRVAL